MDLRRHSRTARALWAPSLVRRVVRHRVAQLCGLALVAILIGLSAQSRLASLEAERAEWGSAQRVFVVTEPVGVGESLAGAVELREFPAALLPPGAVTELDRGALARAALYRGEVLLADRVTGTADGGLPEGTVAITLALHGQAPLVDQGALIDVWTVDSANLSSLRVASRVLVLDRSDDAISVAIPAARIADVTVAALRPVIVTLLG